MFRKEKVEEKANVNPSGSASGYQMSSVQKVGDRMIEQSRVVVSQTTSSCYASSMSTNMASLNLAQDTFPTFNQSRSLLNVPSIEEDFTQQFDGIPLSPRHPLLLSSASELTYKSPFSRTLGPYRSERQQSANVKLSKLEPSDLFSRTSSYSSIRKPSPVLSTSAISLPVSNREAAKHEHVVPRYTTNGKKRVIVINNIKFLEKKEERKGAEVDEKSICRLFKDMGMDVDVHRDLKQSTMKDKLKSFASNSALKKADMSIVVMMSHGSNIDDSGQAVRGSFTQIYGVDAKGLHIDEVLDMFSGQRCPALAGKPKIFIFQCCRGDGMETVHVDAAPIKSVIRTHSDMLVAYSTLPGFFSLRDTIQGSWYIQSICSTFKKHAQDFDVETLLKIVDEELSKKHPTYMQTSTYESRGFKQCFLNPK